jgi:hypothetical protein
MISVHFDATPVIDFKSANGIMIHSKILSGLLQEEFILPSARKLVYNGCT